LPSGDEWAALVAADTIEPIRRTFASKGASGPELRWNPDATWLGPAPLRFLEAHWTALKGDARWPRPQAIDPLELRPALGYVCLVDPVEGGADFRYRLFGSLVAHVSGFDMTGRLLSEHPSSPYVVAFYRACALAVLRAGTALGSVHSPPVAVSTTTWHRLLLPLGDPAAGVTRLLVGSVPVGRDGRAIGTR
jgi:hypothetical protein